MKKLILISFILLGSKSFAQSVTTINQTGGVTAYIIDNDTMEEKKSNQVSINRGTHSEWVSFSTNDTLKGGSSAQVSGGNFSCGGCTIRNTGKLTFPEEIKKEVTTFLIDRTCSKCVEGLMRPTGLTLNTYPAQYPHKCTKCPNTETYLKTYPYTIVE